MSPTSLVFNTIIPLRAKREREVANLTEKNPHTPVYSVKEFVCPSVCGQL